MSYTTLAGLVLITVFGPGTDATRLKWGGCLRHVWFISTVTSTRKALRSRDICHDTSGGCWHQIARCQPWHRALPRAICREICRVQYLRVDDERPLFWTGRRVARHGPARPLSRRRLCGISIKILRRVRHSCCIVASTSTQSTRYLLDGVAVSVPHRSTEPGRPRHRREMN